MMNFKHDDNEDKEEKEVSGDVDELMDEMESDMTEEEQE